MNKYIENLKEEPSCSANRNKTPEERKRGCSRPTPGATAGGCAFDGAQIVLLPLSDAAHIVHGPINCCAHSFNNRGTLTAKGHFHKIGFTTALSEMDIIMGSAKKLEDTITYVIKNYSPKAVFVYETCVTAMTGEHIEDTCKKMEQLLGISVIPVFAPGFAGSKNLGNKAAGDAVLKNIISGHKLPLMKKENSINIIGEYNIAGELYQMLPILNECGINIAASITGGASYDDIMNASTADASVVICSRALVSLGKALKNNFGIDYVEGSFYGMKQIRATLLSVAELMENDKLAERIKNVLNKYEEKTKKMLEPYISVLQNKKVLVYTGGVKSWSIAYQLEELGMEVVKSSTRKSTENDIEKMLRLFEGNEEKLMPKGDGKKIIDTFYETNSDILLAGGRNMYNAMKAKIPFVDVNQERLWGYAGYSGMIKLAESLCNELKSPVFNIAKASPPWRGQYA